MERSPDRLTPLQCHGRLAVPSAATISWLWSQGNSHATFSDGPWTRSFLALYAVCVRPGLPQRSAKPAPPDALASSRLTGRGIHGGAGRAADHFSGSILIARDGKVLFSRGYGMANLELDVPNTPETKFRLGSITKQFTAMAYPDPPGTGQAERPGQGEEIPPRRPQGLGRDHDPPSAHAHLGHSQLHRAARLSQDACRFGSRSRS